MMGKAIANLRKPTLYDLFTMHAHARGKLVESRDRADTVFEPVRWRCDGVRLRQDHESEFLIDPPKRQQEIEVVYCTAEQGKFD